jgi:hypothetical protein
MTAVCHASLLTECCSKSWSSAISIRKHNNNSNNNNNNWITPLKETFNWKVATANREHQT